MSRDSASDTLLDGSFYRSLFELASDGIILIRGDRLYACNEKALELLGRKREDVIGRHPWDISADIQPGNEPAEQRGRRFLQLGYSGQQQKFEWVHIDHLGNLVTLEVSLSLIPDSRETILLCNLRDISDRLEAEQALALSEEKYAKAFRVSPSAILLARLSDGTIVDVNQSFEKLTGSMRHKMCGQQCDAIGLWQQPKQWLDIMSEVKQSGVVRDYAVQIDSKTKGERDLLCSADSISIKDEQCVLCHFSDVTDARLAEARLHFQANHDSLTDLPNRSAIMAHIEQSISKAGSEHLGLVLVLMDLDSFKEINDTLGHHIGDLILQQIGPRLKPMIEQSGGQLARLGGDEFALLFLGLHSKKQIIERLGQIIELFTEPFNVEGMALKIVSSMGIARFPLDGDDMGELMRCADVAMYQAKEQRQHFAFYQADKDRYSTTRLTLLNDLHAAINEGQLRLHYQPKLDIASHKVVGVEALIRWHHPTLGMLPPGQFVPLAEMGESIHPMTNWVLEHAISQCSQWQRQGLDLAFAVNLSTRNLMDEGCAQHIQRLLSKYGVSADRLELEVTESAFIKDPERALSNLSKINNIGVRLAIDDFGTGYSSMAYLKRMPLHTLKIDMTFVQHMTSDPKDAVMVNSVVNLSHNMGLAVVAEGVEDKNTLDMLRAMGCDIAQGYHIAKPMPCDEFNKWYSSVLVKQRLARV